MKCKITIYTTSEQIRALDYQIIKAKTKLQELKSRKILLCAKLRMIREALNEAKHHHKKSVACGPDDASEEISDMFGKVLCLKNGEGHSLPLDEQLGIKLNGMSLDQK